MNMEHTCGGIGTRTYSTISHLRKQQHNGWHHRIRGSTPMHRTSTIFRVMGDSTRLPSHEYGDHSDVWSSDLARYGAPLVVCSMLCCCMHAHADTLTPYQRGLQLQYGLTEDSRIRKCDAGAQPNCVSTSSGTTRLYAPPFVADNAPDPRTAMDALEDALRDMYGSRVDVVESMDVDGDGLYRRFAVPSALVDKDYVEVLIRGTKDVFYRSQGSSTKYIWPIQQPITDLDAQRKRMASLRENLGWKVLVGNCSVLECYQN